jgi:hypothetical protein
MRELREAIGAGRLGAFVDAWYARRGETPPPLPGPPGPTSPPGPGGGPG